jgi:predicted nucleotidyltransferase
LTHPVLERRRRERDALVAHARRYGEVLTQRLHVRAVVVFGSVARGDFNAWSDVDVLVIAEDLPDGARARLALLHDPAFPGIEPVGWTPEELPARLQQGDPIATEAATVGLVVGGELP